MKTAKEWRKIDSECAALSSVEGREAMTNASEEKRRGPGRRGTDKFRYDQERARLNGMPPEAHAEAGERDMRPFPIQDGPTVPWYVMAPHEGQCQKNHSQSLKRIAERGGFGCAEAYAVTHGIEWRELRNDLDGYRKKWFEYAEQFNLTRPAPAAGTKAREEGKLVLHATDEHPAVAKDSSGRLFVPKPPATADAHLCPVNHGAEHEMELVWYCETCGNREPSDDRCCYHGEGDLPTVCPCVEKYIKALSSSPVPSEGVRE